MDFEYRWWFRKFWPFFRKRLPSTSRGIILTKELEKLESIGATFQPLIPTCINWAWAHVRDPEMRDNEAIFFWPCTRRFDDDGQEKRKEKKKKKRNSHKFESIITLAFAASSRTRVSLLLGRVSSIPREDRVASFKNFELQISSG